MCLLRCSKTSATRSWTCILRPSRRFLMEGWGQLEPPPAVPPLPPQTRPRLPRPAQPSPKDDGKPSQLSNLEPLLLRSAYTQVTPVEINALSQGGR
ncbi:hypothetical protein CesoFtcFv8_016965 [Champsocephalus esox]|uniref:Uncharacterized protein n=1 Tax=Champsocephalus esox TaxID=159716 RepID=A0AAN8BK48_9TELE|nr:hypothetical protein CesoFtcFv8_016965 [Champsocephalus esox]